MLTVSAGSDYDKDVTFIGRQINLFNTVHVVVDGASVFDEVIEEDGDTVSYAATALTLSARRHCPFLHGSQRDVFRGEPRGRGDARSDRTNPATFTGQTESATAWRTTATEFSCPTSSTSTRTT